MAGRSTSRVFLTVRIISNRVLSGWLRAGNGIGWLMHDRPRRRLMRARWCLWASAGLAVSAPALAASGGAQDGGYAGSHAVVQQVPENSDPSHALDAALARLAHNPRDGDALIAAGNAALALGDTDAAAGFFSRADRLAPGNPHVELALASARLRGGDPMAAINLFDAAEKAGPLAPTWLPDRGLAHDMVGDNLTAQRYYREALAAGAGDDTAERLAISLAIYGDRRAVEATLAPLMQKQDRAAWRTRAFAFAILGREEEAVAIARSTMPTELANAMAPYLRYMGKLTAAQQAAAANLGKFPRAADIGHDDPRLTAFVAAHGIHHVAYVEPVAPVVPVKGKDRRKKDHKPKPEQLAVTDEADHGADHGADRSASGNRVDAAPPGEPVASRSVDAAPASVQVAAPAIKPPAPKPAPAPIPSVAVPVVQPVPSPVTVPKVVPAAPVPVMAANVATPPLREPMEHAPEVPTSIVSTPTTLAPVSGPVASAPALAQGVVTKPVDQPAPVIDAKVVPASPASVVPAAPPRRPSFTEAFGAWGHADTQATPRSGAVDIRKIAAPRPAVPKAPKAPPPPKYPARVWVQVGVGRNAERIAFDWRKLQKAQPKLTKGRQAWTSDWGRTNRFLIGPFDDEAAAHAYVEKLKRAGDDDVFVWDSPEGQAVDPL